MRPPINLKLIIPTQFEALITNMMMKILANLIFKVKTKKKIFLNFMSIDSDLRKKYFLQKL